MKKALVLLIAVLLSNFIFGQIIESKSAQGMLRDRGEVHFKFSLPEDEPFRESISLLSDIVSIDNVRGNEITAYANAEQFGRFIDLNIDFEVLTPPSMIYRSILENASSSRNTDDWDYYPSYGEYIDMMYQFAQDYPNLCEVVNIGQSVNDRDLLFIHINDSLGVAQNEPEFMYTSTMHGDEVIGYVLMLRYIDYLLRNYGTDPEITNLVDNIDIWINPLANPDGAYATGNNSVYGATRNNANNVDLNRNYPDPEDGPHPDGNEYQSETVAFMDFAEEHDFVMSSNLHTGAEVVNYPWDTWAQLAADDDWWVYVSREYADTVHAYSPYGYFTDLNNGITNGYAWYSINGGRQDYMNYFHNCREMTLELSTIHMVPGSDLPLFWEYNYRSFNNYMKQSLNGFSGIVTNAVSGSPLQAKVFIENHEIDNSWVFSHLPIGNYNRQVKAGTYDVTFSAFGCYDKTIHDLTITDDANVVLNVELVPIGALLSDFYASTTLTGVGSDVDFFDNSIGQNIVSWLWTFEGGSLSTSDEENPVGIVYDNIGDFDVTLTVGNSVGEYDTKFMEDYISVKEAFNIDNGTVTTCNALFFDSGGENGDYTDNEEFTMTFFPDAPNSMVKLEFVGFNVESHYNCDFDYLEIFDGKDISAPLMGKWCGTNGPGTVMADNEEGALTVYFYSNGNITLPGWKAVVSCDSNVGIHQVDNPEITVCPNPANTELNILFKGEITDVTLSDIRGRLLYHMDRAEERHNIDVSGFDRGIYLLSFMHRGNAVVRKIVVD